MDGKQVVVYTSENCDECQNVMDYLTELNIEFEEKNTTHDRNFLKELQQKNVYVTPAVFINDRCILGLRKHKIKNALGV
ncbi:glutaredoxin family protein [Saliterribacillus persicus]|uniref:Glutaredoxin-like protein NrdH n=1 Tax=Saliterribacillus persicus TaxID=930114 RepID=A0A368XYI5_9BACI|nr:glutaredoxin family protein [Saliterribacillus persicus]RCW73042.1 glutaredoxin-like protein NrdH [Saliterribacillus persicus]